MPDRILYRSALSGPGDAFGSWTTVAPRKEIEAEFSIGDAAGGWGEETAALQIGLPDVAGGQGKWVRTLASVAGGASYRLTARFKTKGVRDPRSSVYARVLWKDAGGGDLSHDKQEYFAAEGKTAEDGQWSTITGVRTAPPEAGTAELQLVAAWAPGALVSVERHRMGGVGKAGIAIHHGGLGLPAAQAPQHAPRTMSNTSAR